MTLKVVELKTPNLRDVAAQFRAMADRIESGEMLVQQAVVVLMTPKREITIHGFGDISDVPHVVGLLTIAAQYLIR